MKIYKFYAEWCAPCRQLTKQLEQSDIKDLITEIDCDNDVDNLCGKYSIRNIPTIVFTDDDGNVLDKLVGLVKVETIKDMIARYQ